MDESCYINESVLLNYFAGELPADRRKEVEEWIAASEDNEKMARDIFRLYRRGRHTGLYESGGCFRSLTAGERQNTQTST